MTKKLTTIFAMLAVTVNVVITYIFIHELGHGIVVIASGGRITRLSIALARTWYDGADTSPWAVSLNNIAGMLLPVLLSLAGLFFYQNKVRSFIYQFAYGLFLVMTTSSVLVWIFLPVISLFAQTSPTDDVTRFLVSSNLPPLLVAVMGIIIIALLISFAFVKKLPQGFICSLKTAINTKNNESVSSKKALALLSTVLLILISITVLLEIPFLLSQPIIRLTISDAITSTDYESKFAFVVPESKEYKYDIKLEASGYLTDIRIQDEAQNVLYQTLAESISTQGNLTLSAGEYTIYLTHLQDLEAFDHYCQTMDYTFDGDTETINSLKSTYENIRQEPSLSFVIK